MFAQIFWKSVERVSPPLSMRGKNIGKNPEKNLRKKLPDRLMHPNFS
jgi:hypothetical protein